MIPLVLKRPAGPCPWQTFGCSPALYRRWAPHACGIAACRSLILARHGRAPTLWQLVDEGRPLGVFVEAGDEIRGAFHLPLADLLRRYGIDARIYGGLTEPAIAILAADGPVLASIDLARAPKPATGSHLILLTAWEPGCYTVLDSAGVLGTVPARVEAQKFARMSNGKGVAVSRW